MVLETEATQERILNSNDRCDAECSAQAYVIVKGVSGELMFCGHHYNKIISSEIGSEKLNAFSYEIIDQTDRLVENRLIGEN